MSSDFLKESAIELSDSLLWQLSFSVYYDKVSTPYPEVVDISYFFL